MMCEKTKIIQHFIVLNSNSKGSLQHKKTFKVMEFCITGVAPPPKFMERKRKKFDA